MAWMACGVGSRGGLRLGLSPWGGRWRLGGAGTALGVLPRGVGPPAARLRGVPHRTAVGPLLARARRIRAVSGELRPRPVFVERARGRVRAMVDAQVSTAAHGRVGGVRVELNRPGAEAARAVVAGEAAPGDDGLDGDVDECSRRQRGATGGGHGHVPAGAPGRRHGQHHAGLRVMGAPVRGGGARHVRGTRPGLGAVAHDADGGLQGPSGRPGSP